MLAYGLHLLQRTLLEERIMLSWAVAFLVIALIAGVLGFTGVAGTAANIAWILFVVGLVVALALFITGRRRPHL